MDARDSDRHAHGRAGTPLSELNVETAVERAPSVPDRRRPWVDGLLVLLFSAIAYGVGVHYVRTAQAAGLKPEFYQFEFGPAVMLACGHGYVSPAEHESAILDQFLNVQRDGLDCRELPSNPRVAPLSVAQFTWKYLLWGTAAVWVIWGVSWSHLVALCGLMFAATVALAFMLSRLIAGPVASSAVAIAVLLSPLHWSQVPQFRDYSKAPFMLGLILLTALAVRAPATRRRLLVVAAAFGIVLGVGTGFRGDLLIVVPPFVVAVVAFVPGGLTRQLKLKAAALVIAALGFMAAALPILGVYAGGGGMQVLGLLGFVTPFDQPLRVERGPYEFGYVYSDWYVDAIVRDFARRRQHVAEPIPVYRDVFNAAANGVIAELIKTWPADIVARAYASTIGIASLPASNWTDSHWPPFLPPTDRWTHLFEARARLLTYVPWIWPTAVVVALLVGSMVDMRLAIFATFLLLFFSGYPGVQYHERHFFQLNVVPLLAVAFLGGQAARLTRWRGTMALAVRRAAHYARRAAVFGGLVFLLLFLTLTTVRAYQTSHLRDAIADRVAAPRDPVLLTPRQVAGSRVIYETGVLPARTSAEAHPGIVTSEYLIVRMGGERCDALHLPITIRYDAPFPKGDLSTTMQIRMPLDPAARADLLTPVFYRFRTESDLTNLTDRSSVYQFRGFEVEARDQSCLQRVDRIVDVSRFPLLITATLTPRWRDATFYQTLVMLEQRSDVDGLNTFTAPPDLSVSRKLLSSRLQPLVARDRAKALRPNAAGGWTLDGVGGLGGLTGPSVYLLMADARPTRTGDQLIVEGVLRGGGLSIGFLRNNQWLAHTLVSGAGRFLAVVQVPSDGESTVVIANNLAEGERANHFDIVRAGWLDAGSAP